MGGIWAFPRIPIQGVPENVGLPVLTYLYITQCYQTHVLEAYHGEHIRTGICVGRLRRVTQAVAASSSPGLAILKLPSSARG